MLRRMIENIAKNPAEAKYRKVRTNPNPNPNPNPNLTLPRAPAVTLT